MTIKKLIFFVFSLCLLTLFTLSCADLAVDNENEPDRDKVLAEGEDVESLVGSTYLTFWQATQTLDMPIPFSTLADELTSQWGNWDMGTWAREPRREFENSTTSSYYLMTARPWFGFYECISTAVDGIQAMNGGLEIGTNNNDAVRLEAFSRYVLGVSHGYLALIFDKAFIVDETTDLNVTPEFKPYQEVADAGIAQLEACIQLCENNDFVLPPTWISGVAATNQQLAEYAHSFAARILAGVARTPEERAAVDWAEVTRHANAGITSEFIVEMDGNFWYDGMKYFGSREDWMKADYFTIGHADTSGNFEAWATAEPGDRAPFIIHTADRRIAGPDSTTAPGTDFMFFDTFPFESYRGSYYGSIRYFDHFANIATGPVSCFNPAELRLLKAEALYRQGDLDGAAQIVNETRTTRGGLDPIDGSNPDLWELLKYEKRIEIFITTGGLMYFERRGWGELGTGAPLQFPVPAGELEVLQLDTYTFGGEGGDWAAKRNSTFRLQSFSEFLNKTAGL